MQQIISEVSSTIGRLPTCTFLSSWHRLTASTFISSRSATNGTVTKLIFQNIQTYTPTPIRRIPFRSPHGPGPSASASNTNTQNASRQRHARARQTRFTTQTNSDVFQRHGHNSRKFRIANAAFLQFSWPGARQSQCSSTWSIHQSLTSKYAFAR